MLDRYRRHGPAAQLAKCKGLTAAVRLNVFSDLPWERLIDLEEFPTVQFYDYPKIPRCLGRTPDHYYLTFSLSETNEPDAGKALDSGFNVAAPFRDRPARYMGRPVIDGDAHDLRFLDPRPAVMGLTPKGYAVDDLTGFVRDECALYARVWTDDQSTAPQLLDLRRYARDRHWTVYREYADEGAPGAKNHRAAPESFTPKGTEM